MARRRGLDKFAAPQPEPAPETQAQQPTAAPAKAEEKAFEEERLMLFGPPQTQKTILIFAIVGLLVSGIVFFVSPPAPLGPEALPGATPQLHVVPMIFVMIFGGLLGMLLGQLILVYPDGIIILCTLLAIVVAEAVFGAVKYSDKSFLYTREEFGRIVGIAFCAGFVGFWTGFLFYYRRLRARARFQRRYSS